DVEDLGNVPVEQPESLPEGPARAKYLPQIAATCRKLAVEVEKSLDAGRVPVVLGGDHSIAIGTVAGVAHHFGRQQQKVGLLWIDAHADMNTPETTPSGNVHGMPLACCVGLGPLDLTELLGPAPMVDPARVAVVGLRDVDMLEKPHVRSSGV